MKPANIFLDGEGNAFLGDFGIALGQLDRSDERRLAVDRVAGVRVARAAASRNGSAVDRRARPGDHDVRVPHRPAAVRRRQFGGRTASIASSTSRSRRSAPGDPRSPERVDDVLARATDKEPAVRYPRPRSSPPTWRAALAGPTRSLGRAPLVGRAAVGEFRNPYKGLLSFQEADAPDYFGRHGSSTGCSQRLEDVAGRGRFVALVGPSGAGKSSVIRAGCCPRSARGRAGVGTWFVTTMLPGTHPFEELESALGAGVRRCGRRARRTDARRHRGASAGR